MVDSLSIPEAAALLKLSPGRVHALVAQGRMAAVKIGGRWLVERNEVERRRRSEGLKGRPFAPHNAWALLRFASSEEVERLDPSVRSRLRKALANEGLQQLAPRLVRRAEPRYFQAHRGEIPYIVKDPRLVVTGASGAGALGLQIVPGQEADGYVRVGAEAKFVADHALRPAGPGANVCLRVVPAAAWSFPDEARVAPFAAVALDLAEEVDPRSSAVGRAALSALASS
jgi:excisionase family DNA binding protein